MFVSSRGALSRVLTQNTRCCYSSSAPLSLAAKSSKVVKPSKEVRLKIAQNYNNRRAVYKKAVSQLRKQYADEVAQQRLADEKSEAERKAKETRDRLERQRIKNIRSVKNAMRHEEARLKRAKEFQEELRSAQIDREARAERFEKARRLVLQELEEESVHWLSTPEEVDAAFNGVENEQKLWSRPGGFIGAPLPSEDAEFWRYESHTWDMSKTYQSPREKMMEELEDIAYHESNLDPEYWTDERILLQNEMEQKAKLRALVREEGRKALLLKQREILQDIHTQKNAVGSDGLPAVPSPMPAPSLKVLANFKAMENEGVKILEEDPSKFFIFEGDSTDGKPIGLRDPVRDASPTGTPFPELLGRPPRPDTRTEKEKKRQEREEKMWAAAQAEASSAVEFAAEDEFISGGDPVDYDKLGNYGDEDDLAWEEGLDRRRDAELLSLPRHQRFNDEDLEWMIQHLEKRISSLTEILKLEQAQESGTLGKSAKNKEDDMGTTTVKATEVDDQGNEHTSYHVLPNNIDIDELMSMQDTSVLDTLNEDQISAIAAIDDDGSSMSAEQIRDALSKVPGLTEEQIESLVELELSLVENTSKVSEKTKSNEK
jgi:hypothetical protein